MGSSLSASTEWVELIAPFLNNTQARVAAHVARLDPQWKITRTRLYTVLLRNCIAGACTEAAQSRVAKAEQKARGKKARKAYWLVQREICEYCFKRTPCTRSPCGRQDCGYASALLVGEADWCCRCLKRYVSRKCLGLRIDQMTNAAEVWRSEANWWKPVGGGQARMLRSEVEEVSRFVDAPLNMGVECGGLIVDEKRFLQAESDFWSNISQARRAHLTPQACVDIVEAYAGSEVAAECELARLFESDCIVAEEQWRKEPEHFLHIWAWEGFRKLRKRWEAVPAREEQEFWDLGRRVVEAAWPAAKFFARWRRVQHKDAFRISNLELWRKGQQRKMTLHKAMQAIARAELGTDACLDLLAILITGQPIFNPCILPMTAKHARFFRCLGRHLVLTIGLPALHVSRASVGELRRHVNQATKGRPSGSSKCHAADLFEDRTIIALKRGLKAAPKYQNFTMGEVWSGDPEYLLRRRYCESVDDNSFAIRACIRRVQRFCKGMLKLDPDYRERLSVLTSDFQDTGGEDDDLCDLIANNKKKTKSKRGGTWMTKEEREKEKQDARKRKEDLVVGRIGAAGVSAGVNAKKRRKKATGAGGVFVFNASAD